jgi:alpha-amylase
MSLRNKKSQKSIVLYFQVHQPVRLRPFSFFDIGNGQAHFDDGHNREVIQRVSRACYLPTNAMLLRLIAEHPEVRIAFSVSGSVIDQFREYAPEVLESFKALAQSPSVEFLGETDYHSLACLMPGDEFEIQVLDQVAKLHEHFGVRPTIFRNTELIYSDDVARRAEALGFRGILADGAERLLHQRSPHHLYQAPDSEMKLMLRNYRLSDDIAFRYIQDGKALTTTKYMSWLSGLPAGEELVVLGMDYETFGEHHRDSGILQFLESFLKAVARHKSFRMLTPSEVIATHSVHETLSVPHYTSWADEERDLSAWLGNDMQNDAFESLMRLEQDVRRTNDAALTDHWRKLQTSDHFYYMSTKKNADGNVHAYFSPFNSPYEAFINYMNVLQDFTLLVKSRVESLKEEVATSVRAETERQHPHVPKWAMALPSNYDHQKI